jgi:hypothetical protein
MAGSATEAPRFPGELPPIWNMPYHLNPYSLAATCCWPRSMPTDRAGGRQPTGGVTGLAGMGKTQLAVEHAYRQRADYNLVRWVRSEQPTSLLGDYAALAGQRPLASDLRLAEDASQETVAAAVRVWLERHRHWLLVLDNVEEPAVAELLPRSGTGHVLLTTHHEELPKPLAAAAGDPIALADVVAALRRYSLV